MDTKLIDRLAKEAGAACIWDRLPQFAALVAEECARIAESVETPFGRDDGEVFAAAAIRAAFPKG